MIAARKTLFGTTIEEGTYIPVEQPVLQFQQQYDSITFGIDKKSLYRNILLLGSAGSGKTNTSFLMIPQFQERYRKDKKGVGFIFDTKADYITHTGFYQPGDYIISNDRRYRDRSVSWNIFDEVLIDGYDPRDYETNCREIATILFQGRENKSQPFFTDAPRDIFAWSLIYFIRRSIEDPTRWKKMLNTEYFIASLLKKTPQDFITMFRGYSDMKGLISYIGDGSSNQALGVLGELRSMIYDCFQGVFCRVPTEQNPSFSIRKAIREKGGKTIFLIYDLSTGETLLPMYRLLVDLALKESFHPHTDTEEHTHFFLDEMKLLPNLTHLDDVLNFARDKNVSVVAGLQSIGQLYSAYGKEKGQVILGAFGNIFAFHTSDYESREYITKLFGPNMEGYRYYNGNHVPIDREREGNTVEHWDIQRLQTGEAMIGLSSQSNPFLFHFEQDRE